MDDDHNASTPDTSEELTASLQDTSATPATPADIDTPATPGQSRDSLHAQICRLRREGLSLRRIAAATGAPLYKVHRIVHREIRNTRALMTGRKITREEMLERINSLAPQALETVAALGKHAKKEDVKLRASADILDRAGYNPINKNINMNIYDEMPRHALLQTLSSIILQAEGRPADGAAIDTKPGDLSSIIPRADQSNAAVIPSLSTAQSTGYPQVIHNQPVSRTDPDTPTLSTPVREGGVAFPTSSGGTLPQTSDQKSNLHMQSQEPPPEEQPERTPDAHSDTSQP